MSSLRCGRCGRDVLDDHDGLIVEFGVLVDGDLADADVIESEAICNGCLTSLDLQALGITSDPGIEC
jgi:hypothetical protein